MRSDRTRAQRGGIMVLVAALSTVIVLFVAIAFDFNFLEASKDQAQHFSRIAALAGIEEYFSHPCPTWRPDLGRPANIEDCHELRMWGISKRIDRISQDNVLVATPGTHIKTSGTRTADNIFTPTITAGQWITKDPAAPAAPITCADGTTAKPCFIARPSNELANAFRIQVSYPLKSAVKFSSFFFAMSDQTITVSATATVTPRRGVFLVDVSGSVTRDTYKNALDDLARYCPHPDATHPNISQPASCKLGEYAFYLKSDNTDNYPDPATAPFALDHEAEWSGFSTPGNPDYIPGIRTWVRPGTPDPDPERKLIHYGSDYVKKRVWGDDVYPHLEEGARQLHPDPSVSPKYTAGESDWYRIDNYEGGDWQGPEPLRTIFLGLQTAMTQFKQRSVAGDQASIIFYDDQLAWPRVYNLTADFDSLIKATDFVHDNMSDDPATIYSSFGATDVVLDPPGGREHAVRHRLFPAANGQTDMWGALNEAFFQLSHRETGVETSDFIVHIGDGMPTCCQSTTNCPSSLNRCNATYDFNRQAIEDVEALVQSEAVRKLIPIHMIQIGSAGGPHTVDIEDPQHPGTCLHDEAQIRASEIGRTYVKGGDAAGTPLDDTTGTDAFDSASPTTPFFQAAKDMYQFAYETHGVWGPVRAKDPACPAGGGALATAPCRLDGSRRMFDPKCRTTQAQVQDYITEIMTQNPYTIVDVR